MQNQAPNIADTIIALVGDVNRLRDEAKQREAQIQVLITMVNCLTKTTIAGFDALQQESKSGNKRTSNRTPKTPARYVKSVMIHLSIYIYVYTCMIE